MKKSLLLASVALFGAGTLMAEDVDITPKGYIFHETNQMCAMHPDAFHGANIQTKPDGTAIPGQVYVNIEGDKYYDNGLLVVGGGQFHNYANGHFEHVKSCIQLVNLGGEVGSCFAFVAPGCNVKEALKAYNNEDYNITPGEGAYNWFNLNFFSDPNNTPTESAGNIRVRVVYNVYSPTYDLTTNAVNNTHFKTQDNGVRPGGNNGAMTLGDCFTENELTEDFEYDPTKWCVYEFVSNCSDAEDALNFAPMRLVLNLPGSGNNTGALFIREITMAQTSDLVADATKTYIKLTPGKPAGVSEIEAAKATYSVNGNTATFSAEAEVYNLMGAKVAQGKAVTLASGIYVARVGAEAVKFVVK